MRASLSGIAASSALFALLAVSGCERGPTTVTEPPRGVPGGVPGTVPAAVPTTSLDASSGGSQGFYFLPPTVAVVPAFSGVFDGSLLPELSVELCELDAAGACPSGPVVIYTATAADYRSAIRVNAPRELYVVYWEVAPTDAGVGRAFRASVIAAGSALGHVDFPDPVAGRWLPVVFRIEEGAVGEEPPPVSPITSNVDGTRVGRGLQSGTWSFVLDTPAPGGGLDVHLRSGDPSLLRLAPDAATAGAEEIVVAVPAGATDGTFWVQGVEGAAGTAEVAFVAEGHAGTATVTVAPVAADLFLLPASLAASASDVPFRVRIGALDAAGTGLVAAQGVRTGGVPLDFTVSNADAAVGRLVTADGTGQLRTVTVPVGASLSPADVGAGGIAFDPVAVGTTTVTLTHPTVTLLEGARRTVEVTDGITVRTRGVRVGAGLQYLAAFTLGAPAPAGGVTVHLESSDPGLLLLAPDASSAATPALDVTVGAGLGGGGFTVVGVEGAAGTATIEASAPGYAGDAAPMIVTEVGVRIILLAATQDAGGANDPFVVQIGAIGPSGTSLYTEQDVRVGGVPVVVDLANGEAAVAQLVTDAGPAQSATVTIGVGRGRSPVGVAAGGVELDPLAPGETSVRAQGAGLVPMAGATVLVTVR